MQFNKSLLTATLLAAVSLTAVSANAAGTATGNFDVKIKIVSACTVDAATGAQDINFGEVAAGTAITQTSLQSKTSATALSVKCSKGAPYVINLTPSSKKTDGTGIMTRTSAPTDTINYQLSSTTGTYTAWGNTGSLGATGNGVGGTGTGVTKVINHPVYATVTGSTDVTVGDYVDTVNVSVIY